MDKKRKMLGRIRYDENWHNEGEHFVFEWKWSDEPDNAWSLDHAYGLHEVSNGKLQVGHGNGDFISYTALTQVREWLKRGMEIHFV